MNEKSFSCLSALDALSSLQLTLWVRLVSVPVTRESERAFRASGHFMSDMSAKSPYSEGVSKCDLQLILSLHNRQLHANLFGSSVTTAINAAWS